MQMYVSISSPSSLRCSPSSLVFFLGAAPLPCSRPSPSPPHQPQRDGTASTPSLPLVIHSPCTTSIRYPCHRHHARAAASATNSSRAPSLNDADAESRLSGRGRAVLVFVIGSAVPLPPPRVENEILLALGGRCGRGRVVGCAAVGCKRIVGGARGWVACVDAVRTGGSWGVGGVRCGCIVRCGCRRTAGCASGEPGGEN
ncbi:hypothetical protein B0H16DRAFT_1536350 [Mycena metata]|uniref:Uncharacterized protein n=1 Tax=Mycena metata TaxID=1033252 RepID=A0AAD7JA95_9AGAR|nr:hypothetical protein B0H16DRAFT_1536350 [Mycena metata]